MVSIFFVFVNCLRHSISKLMHDRISHLPQECNTSFSSYLPFQILDARDKCGFRKPDNWCSRERRYIYWQCVSIVLKVCVYILWTRPSDISLIINDLSTWNVFKDNQTLSIMYLMKLARVQFVRRASEIYRA